MKRALMLLFFTTLTSHTVLAVDHELMGLLLAKTYLDDVYEMQAENLNTKYSENAKGERPSRDSLKDEKFEFCFGEDYTISKTCHETAAWRYLQQRKPIVSDCEGWTFVVGGGAWGLSAVIFDFYTLINWLAFNSDDDGPSGEYSKKNIIAPLVLTFGPPIVGGGYVLLRSAYRKLLYKYYYKRALDNNEKTWIKNSLEIARRLLATTAKNGSNADEFPEDGHVRQIANYYKDLKDKFEEVKKSINESVLLDLQISNEYK